jgi:hypothetical protein
LTKTGPFWRTTPLEELAKQQGVSAVDDLDEITALWTAEDDPDELLRYLLGERFERHRYGENSGSPAKGVDSGGDPWEPEKEATSA